MQPFDALNKLEQATFLDPAISRLYPLVHRALDGQTVRDALHGVWLGHPLHPMAVQVPIGAWMSSVVVDCLPGQRRSAEALIATGLAAAAPAVAAGVADWAEVNPPERRSGLVHAMTNTVAVGCYTASLVARARGRTGTGKAWGLAGLVSVALGGTIGGHLSYRRAVGANRNADVPDIGPDDWTEVVSLDDLPEGSPTARQVGTLSVLLLRSAGSVRAMVDRCAHLSGPLHSGELVDGSGATGAGIGGDACIRCPWHGSTFRLRDGAVIAGPATAPQPVLETQVRDGRVAVRLPATPG